MTERGATSTARWGATPPTKSAASPDEYLQYPVPISHPFTSVPCANDPSSSRSPPSWSSASSCGTPPATPSRRRSASPPASGTASTTPSPGVAKALQERTGRTVLVIESPGTEANIELLRGGDVDLALIQTVSSQPEGVAGIAPLFPEPLHFIVRKGQGDGSPKDLAGRRVALG